MKAAYIKTIGAPDVIIVDQLPLPSLSSNQVLVEVAAVAVDPIDTYIRSGAYKIDLPFPFIIGRDMVGAVRDVGSSVQSYKRGDRVWCNNQGYAGRQGTFAETIAVDEELLYPLGDSTDPINLVAAAHSALTAVVGLVTKARLKEGETLFINGGSGNVGRCATQLAKRIGAKVAVTAGSAEKSQWCRADGADLVIDYKNEDVEQALKKFASDGVDVYWDLTRQPDLQKAIDCTARRGRIVISSGLAHTSQMKIGSFYTHNLSMLGFTITDLSKEELAEHAAILNPYFQQNVFRPRIAKTLTLEEAAEAHRLVENGIDGKVVVRVRG